jgi:ribosomal-protein-alanine acetyltransferase
MPEPAISIQLARRGDVLDIACGSRDLIEHGLAWSWTPSRVYASLRSRTARVIVARVGDRFAGFAIMRYGGDDAHLDLLAVDPEHRGRGIGRQLVEWLEKPALVAGISSVLLEVRARNSAARAFYARLGYRTLGRIAGYYQGREPAIRMVHALGCRGAAPVVVWKPSAESAPRSGSRGSRYFA